MKRIRWLKYEIEKAALKRKNLTPQEYERRVRKLAARLKV